MAAFVGLGLTLARQRAERVAVRVVPAEQQAQWDRALHAARIVSLNTATATELERLPGIGPTLAARIVSYREQHGPFASVEALDRVEGIGPSLLGQLHEYLRL